MGKLKSPKATSSEQRTVIGSLSSSLNSQDVGITHTTLFGQVGVCKGEPLTQYGKRIQLVKMLCLTALPVLGLWAYTVYTLADTIESKQLNEKTRNSLAISIKLSRVIHRLQRERDMSMLYLSALGPETKTFLLQEYIETDKELAQMTVWPVDLDRNERQEFQSKDKFQENLSRHRQVLSPSFDPVSEMHFYTALIDKIILWLYDSITESRFSLVWKSVVAYQKITSGKEDVGLERALGTMFYARGGFQEHKLFEMYNNKVFAFRAQYETARLYSDRVDFLYSYGVTYSGVNITEIVYDFRKEIQFHNRSHDYKSIQKARWLFDNMTTYLELLYDVQRDLGEYVIEKVDQVIQHSTRDLAISATFLVLVIVVCPLVIFATENLTSSIQKYALTLVDKTKELTQEQKRTDSLLYQMVPQPVAEKLKNNVHIDAEYFKTVTILFSDIYGFARLCANCSPLEIVQILNQLYGAIDDILDDLDVYKVETVNDCYMVASGLPNRNGGRHVVEIADFSIALVKLMKSRTFGSNVALELRIGINTGPCMAGVVGSVMPRYCLFGDTVNTASRMKSYGQPNRVHVSHSTYKALNKHSLFVMKKRGSVTVKGKGEMKTYWLQGKTFELSSLESSIELDQRSDKQEIPGEIAAYEEEPTYRFALNFPLPGRTKGESHQVPKEESPESLRSSAKIMAVAPSMKSFDDESREEKQRLVSDKEDV